MKHLITDRNFLVKVTNNGVFNLIRDQSLEEIENEIVVNSMTGMITTYPMVECLSIAKEPNEKLFYIPIEWLDHYGMTEADLKDG